MVKKNHKKLELEISKVIFILYIIVAFAGCSEEKIEPSVLKTAIETQAPSQESWNSKVYFTEDGKLKAALTAGHIMMFDNKNETLLDDVKIDFYNEDQVRTSTLTSKKGKVDDITKNMWAIDSVVAVNDSGVTLQTQELMWRNKDRKIISDKFVTITTPKEKIQGYGLESDQGLDHYVIHNITFVTSTMNSQNHSSTKKRID